MAISDLSTGRISTTRRTLVGFMGLVAAGGAEAFAAPVPAESVSKVQAVAGAVTNERMAFAIEQLARAVRAGAVMVENIEVLSSLTADDIEGRQTITIKAIHMSEVPIS